MCRVLTEPAFLYNLESGLFLLYLLQLNALISQNLQQEMPLEALPPARSRPCLRGGLMAVLRPQPPLYRFSMNTAF